MKKRAAKRADDTIGKSLALMSPAERLLLFTKLNDDYPLSVRQMATALRVSPSTVTRWRRDGGDTVEVAMSKGRDGKVRPNHRFDTSERDESIRSMHDAGESLRTIAEKVGCSVGTVHRVVTKRVAPERVVEDVEQGDESFGMFPDENITTALTALLDSMFTEAKLARCSREAKVEMLTKIRRAINKLETS